MHKRNNIILVVVAFLCFWMQEPTKTAFATPTSKTKVKNQTKKVLSVGDIGISSYIQTGYRMTFNDNSENSINTRSLRLGESDGFYIERIHLKFKAHWKEWSAIISSDFAKDPGVDPLNVSPAQRKLIVALNDVYIQYKNSNGFFAKFGQLQVPFSLFSERSSQDEHFSQFPLILSGEDIAFGYAVKGISPSRDIGLLLGFEKSFGLVGLSLKAMAFNGNGANHFGNDSDLPAFSGRLGISIGKFLKLGGGVMWNPRRAGELPSLFEENDLLFGGDLIFKISGFFLESSVMMKTTSYPTTKQEDVTSFGFHVDAGYRLASLNIEPLVRFQIYDPSSQFDDDQLTYITIGINWYHKIWRTHEFMIRASYTIKLEEEQRTLDNDQFDLMLQYRF